MVIQHNLESLNGSNALGQLSLNQKKRSKNLVPGIGLTGRQMMRQD